MDDQYIRGRALAVYDEASEIIEDVSKEYQSPTIDTSESFEEPEIEKIEKVSPTDVLTSSFGESDNSLPDNELDYIKKRGVSISAVDDEDTEGHEYARKSQTAKEHLEAVEKLNTRMKDIGSRARFVATKADSPESAYVYETEGFFYYYKVDDEKMRPSDVTELNKDDSWWLYDDNEKVLKTILALADEYPEVVKEADSVEQVYTFTDRVLKTEDEVVRDEDVFSLKQQDAVVAAIVQTKGTETPTVNKVTSGQVHRKVESARRAIVSTKRQVKSEAPSFAANNIETADSELGDALDGLKSGSMEKVEISLIQASDKLGELLTAMEGEASQDTVDAVEQIYEEVEEAKRMFRNL